MIKHPYHLVDGRPWPLTGSVGVFFMLSGLVRWIQKFDFVLISLGAFIILITVAQWWRDVGREATMQGKHTNSVENGIRYGMILFILREVWFFLAFFWAFFHSSLSPNTDLGSIWPPAGILSINPYDVPLLNTLVLLTSGATITWAHISLVNSIWMEAFISTGATILLGISFTYLQVYEFVHCSFAISDSVFGGVFFLLSGFHGLHVLIGTIFIAVIFMRHTWGHFSANHHFGFEASAWYWHFVDVVWLFLFVCVYWWGS